MNDGEERPSYTDTTGKEKNENQSKLDVLRPMAYGNVEGLNLEPGSYISIIGKNASNSYWKQVASGAKRAVADINSMLGYKGEDKVKLNFIAPDKQDNVDEQINILDEELARYPIALGIAAIDATACSVQFDLATENGIPIVTFDSGSTYQGVAANCSTNNYEAAQTAAIQLAAMMEETGEVAVFVHDSKSTTAEAREKGFLETLSAQFPNVSAITVYHLDDLEAMSKQIAEEKALANPDNPEAPSEDTIKLTQEEVVQYILEKHPNLKGVFATNLDTTQLVADVVTQLEKIDLKIVGFDGGKEQLKLLKNDVVEGLIVQNPYGMGYATVIAAARAALELGNEAVIDSGYIWVTKENMNQSEIKKMLY